MPVSQLPQCSLVCFQSAVLAKFLIWPLTSQPLTHTFIWWSLAAWTCFFLLPAQRALLPPCRDGHFWFQFLFLSIPESYFFPLSWSAQRFSMYQFSSSSLQSGGSTGRKKIIFGQCSAAEEGQLQVSTLQTLILLSPAWVATLLPHRFETNVEYNNRNKNNMYDSVWISTVFDFLVKYSDIWWR